MEKLHYNSRTGRRTKFKPYPDVPELAAPTFTVPPAGKCPTLSREPTLAWAFSLKFSFWFSILTSPPPRTRLRRSEFINASRTVPPEFRPLPSPHRRTTGDPMYFGGGTGPSNTFSVSVSFQLRFSLKTSKIKVGDLHVCRPSNSASEQGCAAKPWRCPQVGNSTCPDRQAGSYPHANLLTRSAHESVSPSRNAKCQFHSIPHQCVFDG